MPRKDVKKKPSAAATFAQRRKQPLPTLKEAVCSALEVAAQQLEAFTIVDVWGVSVDDKTAKIYQEAKEVAVNYVRMGVKG